MTERLAERLAAAHGGPVEIGGRLVRMMFEAPPLDETQSLMVALATTSPRIQGARLKARDGKLVVNGVEHSDLVLWSDTAPGEVSVTLEPSSKKRRMSLRVWNTWRDPAGTMQAWIGDAGLIAEADGSEVITLRCSDGFDEPHFDDLVIRLEFGPASEQSR